MMKITGLSHLFKWENLHNWWLTKYFFAPLCICIYIYIYICICAGTCIDILRGMGSSGKKGTSHIYLFFSKRNVKYIRYVRY